LWQLLDPFDAAEVVDQISCALRHHEVNWKCLLSLTAVMLTSFHDASQHVQGIVVEFICSYFDAIEASSLPDAANA